MYAGSSTHTDTHADTQTLMQTHRHKVCTCATGDTFAIQFAKHVAATNCEQHNKPSTPEQHIGQDVKAENNTCT